MVLHHHLPQSSSLRPPPVVFSEHANAATSGNHRRSAAPAASIDRSHQPGVSSASSTPPHASSIFPWQTDLPRPARRRATGVSSSIVDSAASYHISPIHRAVDPADDPPFQPPTSPAPSVRSSHRPSASSPADGQTPLPAVRLQPPRSSIRSPRPCLHPPITTSRRSIQQTTTHLHCPLRPAHRRPSILHRTTQQPVAHSSLPADSTVHFAPPWSSTAYPGSLPFPPKPIPAPSAFDLPPPCVRRSDRPYLPSAHVTPPATHHQPFMAEK